MARWTLDSMPDEILLQILQYLAHRDVASMSLVDQHCRRVAMGVLVRKTSLHITGRNQLQVDTDHWKTMLLRASCIKDVRCLEIGGEMPPLWEDKDLLGTENVIEAKVDRRRRHQTAEETIDEDSAWTPLAELIRCLPSVTDVHWSCENQFPPCLLAELHARPSLCRLHLHSFWFRSLNRPDWQHHEYALACSPSLYSIRPQIRGCPWQKAALLRTISGLAKSLKTVISADWPTIDYEFEDVFDWNEDDDLNHEIEAQIERPSIPPWPGFIHDKERDRSRRGCLSRLEILTDNFLPLERWAIWQQAADFSFLRYFRLGAALDIAVLRRWTWDCLLTSLEELDMMFDLRVNRGNPADDKEYHEALSVFLYSLPPLDRLRLTVTPLRSGPLTSILDRHGASLRQLHLHMEVPTTSIVFDAANAERIRQQCVLLEDLRLIVPRSHGDKHEQSIYKILGAIPRLQSLSLTLDCSNDAMLGNYMHPGLGRVQTLLPELPMTEEIRCDYRNTFRNSAIDKTLAMAIFRCVSTGKGRGMLPLECFEVCEHGGHLKLVNNGRLDLYDNPRRILACIAGSWRITRNQRDDCRHELSAENLGGIDGMYKSQEEADRMLEGVDRSQFPCRFIEPVFREIWPASPDSSNDWRQDWHSFSLEGFED